MDKESTYLRVSPYARISDTDEERAPGVDRQLRIVHPAIEQRGGKPTRDYVDNNKSAFDPGVYRDDFEQWLQDFEANRTDGIAAYDVDRVFRQPMDLERTIKAYVVAAKKGRPTVFWVKDGSFDLTSTDGQAMIRVLVTFSNKSSGDTARRTTDRYRDEALQGRTYTNYPAFGWNMDGTLNGHAPLRRQAIQDVAAGVRSLTGIAEQWRNAGILTVRGKQWRQSAVRRMVLAPRNAGFVVYQEQMLHDADGLPIKGTWEPLIDEETWRAACAAINGRAKRSPRRTKSLLSGIAVCGKCGYGMVRVNRGNGRYSYGCRSRDSGGCASVAINGNRLDEQIIGLVKAYLRGRKIEAKDDLFPGEARLEEVGSKIAELMAAYRTGDLPGSVVFPNIKELRSEQQELQAAKDQHTGKQHRAMTVEGMWPEGDLEKQRAICRELFEAIVIAPCGRTGLYEEDRVEPIWREP